jgi:hypothetical protein
MKPIQRTYLLVEVEHAKDVSDLTDKVAGRAYTLSGVDGATAILLTSKEAYLMAAAQMDKSNG